MVVERIKSYFVASYVFLTCALCICFAENVKFTESKDPFSVGHASPLKGWVEAGGITAANWKPVEQKNLITDLDSAGQLKITKLAPPPQNIVQGPIPYFCPNPDRKSWDIIMPYRKKYVSEGQVCVHDCASGETKVFQYGSNNGDNVITPCKTDFHMKSSYFFNCKMVFPLTTLNSGPLFLVYDPEKNDFISATTPFGTGFDLFAIAYAENDTKLYGIGLPASKDGFVAFIYDPATFKTTIFEKRGDGQKNPFPYYRGCALQGDWMYFKYGHEPWIMSAFNFKTKEFRKLAVTAPVKGDHSTIRISRYAGGVSAQIKQGESITGASSFDKDVFDCWLVDGKLIPRTDDITPWSKQPAKRRPSVKGKFREFQNWPEGFTYEVPPPAVTPNSAAPVDCDGNVELSYRLPEDEANKNIYYQVSLYPGKVRRLIEINANTLFAVGEGYGQNVFYDIPGKRFKRYLVQRVSPYAIGTVNDRLYVSGYPHFVSVEYDLQKLDKTMEPKFLGYLGEKNDTHQPLAGLVGGADGCVYMAGTTLGRRRDGGGLTWYDMQSGKVGTRVMDTQRVFWLCSANDGRYILLSGKGVGCRSQIYCWDTEKKEFVYNIDSPTSSYAGPIEEALPGLVIGHAVDDEINGGQLFGLEASTGKVLWMKQVPVKPVTSFSQVRRHIYTYRRGPDGFIWATFGKVLVRIDPRTAKVIPVGKLDPCQIAFAADGVYLSGGNALRRVEGLTVKEPVSN